MRGAQRSSLTNWDALLLRLRGGLTGARAHPKPGRRLSRCLADLGPTGTPRGQLDGWMDREGRGGMLQSKCGPCHPHQHPPGLEALHTLWGENIGWLFERLISVIRKRHSNRDDGMGGREA